MNEAPAVSKDDLALLLASALGQDKSDEVVATAARSVGAVRPTFSGPEIHAVFDVLVKAEGLVGVVARFAVSRGDVDKLIARASPPQSIVIGRPRFEVDTQSTAPASGPPTPTVDLIPLLAPALGAETARDAIEAAAARRGVDVATGLSHSGALAVLDEMARIEGIVGVVARFAKARFLLLST
jgi:hypothetical protein